MFSMKASQRVAETRSFVEFKSATFHRVMESGTGTQRPRLRRDNRYTASGAARGRRARVAPSMLRNSS